MEAKSPAPPTLSYKTLKGFVDSLIKNQYLPPVIDSTTMDKLSGRNKIEVKSTLKFLNLMTPEGAPTEMMHHLFETPESERPNVWREILTGAYPTLLGTNAEIDVAKATFGQFRDKFRKMTTNSDATIKAERFFLQAAEQAGIPISKFILDSKRTAGRDVVRAKPPTTLSKPASTSEDKQPGQALVPPDEPKIAQRSYMPDSSAQSQQYNARGLRVTIEINADEWEFWNENRIRRFFSGITESLVAQVSEIEDMPDM